MKGLSILVIVSTLVVGATGCRQCNWFGRPSGAMMPVTTYGSPAMPPAVSPPSCGPGCNSCGSNNTLPVLSAPQGYAAAPMN